MVKHLPPCGCDVVAFDNLSTGYRDAVPLAMESAPRKKCLLNGRMKIGAEFNQKLATYSDILLIV